MKFKCIRSGCIYTFTSDLDIKTMQKSEDYVQVVEATPATATVVPAKVVQAVPIAVAPTKPIPVVPAPTKAV